MTEVVPASLAPFFMDNFLYSNLGNRINKTFKDKREDELLTLKDFLENKWIIHNHSELKSVFIREIKFLLKKENLFDLIDSFFELENNYNITLEKLMIEDEKNLFDDFYKNLSPIVLRALLDISKASNDNELLLTTIKESIRIALEELIYQVEV